MKSKGLGSYLWVILRQIQSQQYGAVYEHRFPSERSRCCLPVLKGAALPKNTSGPNKMIYGENCKLAMANQSETVRSLSLFLSNDHAISTDTLTSQLFRCCQGRRDWCEASGKCRTYDNHLAQVHLALDDERSTKSS